MSQMREFLFSKRIWGMVLLLAAALAATSCGDSQQPAYQPAKKQFATLYSFKGNPDGARPMGSLIVDSAGTLYGTTSTGGTTDRGTIFALDRFGSETVIHSFSDYYDGAGPAAGLTADANDNLYGTTQFGGQWSWWGTVFKADASGHHTVLVNFGNDTDGGCPETRLTTDPDGNFYGGTQVGGIQACPLNGCGVVFKLDSFGQYSVVHYFTGVPDGWGPNDLLRESDGSLYGTTEAGGQAGQCPLGSCGTIFKLDVQGQETVLYRFTGGSDGASPQAGLIRDAAGSFYGATYYGGGSGSGVIFKFDTAGTLTILHSFTGGSDGANPYAGPIWGANGKLYGSTLNGGDYGYGVVFELDVSGAYRVLHSFTGGADGGHPYASLMLGQGNVMYGTTTGGGTTAGPCTGTNWQGCGTIFSVEP